MTKTRLLILFAVAGLILASIAGVYVYQTYREPSQSEIIGVISDFVEKISSGDLPGARELLTEDTASLLRDPGTTLGKTVYDNLSLKSVDQIFSEGKGSYAADVILTVPDALKITTKAGILFAERVTEEGPADDPDALIAEIYDEILAREDLPMLDQFCVVRLEVRSGKVFIRADEQLQKALEGGGTLDAGIFDGLLDTEN